MINFEFTGILNFSFATPEEPNGTIVFDVLEDGSISGDHSLVPLLALSDVEKAFAIPSVVVAVLFTLALVGEDQDVWRLSTRGDSSLSSTSVSVVQFTTQDGFTLLQIPNRHNQFLLLSAKVVLSHEELC